MPTHCISRILALAATLAAAGMSLSACRTASDRLDAERARSAPLDEVKSGAARRAAGGAEAAPGPDAAPRRDPRTLTLHAAGEGGAAATIAWDELVRRAAASDVVLIGETHGHALGLAFAAALWEDVLKSGPSAGESGGAAAPALSLEFFERDEQAAIDDYLAGLTDEAAFRKATERTEGNYPPGHRAMVEAAKAAKRPVIAGNAPRRYVRLARTDGFDRLGALTSEQRRYFDPPASLTEGRYRDEFMRMMGGMEGHEGSKAQSEKHKAQTQEKKGEANAAPPAEEEARLKAEAEAKAKAEAEAMAKKEGFFRSQNLWDATMAESIARGLASGWRPVVHVVGQFHTDYNGGLTERVKAARPGARVMTISVVDESSESLREKDAGRADVVVYVGKKP